MKLEEVLNSAMQQDWPESQREDVPIWTAPEEDKQWNKNVNNKKVNYRIFKIDEGGKTSIVDLLRQASTT